MQTFPLNAGWRRWAPAWVVVASGIALLPWPLKAQTQALREAQTGSVAQKKIDQRMIQMGDYTLKFALDRFRGHPRTPPTPGAINLFYGSLLGSLEITSSSKDKLMLLRGAENLHGRDDSGRAIRCPNGTYFYALAGSPAQDKGVWQATFALATEKDAKSLKTLEGNFLIDVGVGRTFTFTAEEMRPELSKKMGQVTVTVDSVKQDAQDTGDTTMNITYLFPQFDPPPKSFKDARPMLSSEQRIQVEVVGTDGATYLPTSQSETSTGVRPKALPDGIDDGASVISIFTAHLSLKFQTTPRHVHVKSVIVHVFEAQGEIRSVPFKFTDVPFPDSL